MTTSKKKSKKRSSGTRQSKANDSTKRRSGESDLNQSQVEILVKEIEDHKEALLKVVEAQVRFVFLYYYPGVIFTEIESLLSWSLTYTLSVKISARRENCDSNVR